MAQLSGEGWTHFRNLNDLHENAQLKGQKAKASDIVKKGKPLLRQWQLKPLCKLSVKDQTFLLKKVRYVRHCPLNHCQVYPVFKFVWDDLLIQLFNFLIVMIITIIIRSVSTWTFLFSFEPCGWGEVSYFQKNSEHLKADYLRLFLFIVFRWQLAS